MFELSDYEDLTKPQLFDRLAGETTALLEGERDPIANAANLCSLLWHALANINWVGFYFLKEGELVLGPFFGKPACVRIAMGLGVCGTAAAQRVTQRVDDVQAFPGHIACDAASRSEIVVPLENDGTLLGVLDVDSPLPQRFDAEDQAGLETLARIYLASL